jgi:anti-sigma factor RsiW
MIVMWIRHPRYMWEHRWTHGHLSDYLDDDLSVPERRRVERHVDICPQCRRVLATLKRTLAGLAALREEPGVDISGRVMGRLRQEP